MLISLATLTVEQGRFSASSILEILVRDAANKTPVVKKKCFKVEKILKGSLDSIPSPSLSVKIQISS